MNNDALRFVLIGIGNRALPKKPETSNFLGWVRQVAGHPAARLVAAADPAEASRERMVAQGELPPEAVFADIGDMLAQTEADAALVCSPGPCHAGGIAQALGAGLHVLIEKPFVTDIGAGKELLGSIAASGVVSTVVQNWRYKDVGRRMRAFIREGGLGRVGHIFFRYVRNRENPNYPDYIFKEEYPLLYAMGSHHFDLFRHLLGEEVVEVSGSSFKPAWSMYESWTGHSLTMRSAGGVFISYAATISSMNSGLPQESIVIEGEKGTLVNNSDWSEPPLLFYPKGGGTPVDLTADVAGRSEREQYDVADTVILNDFVEAVREGRASDCPAADSFRSLLLLEACREACETGGTIELNL